jgi:ATP synthase subunit 6
MAIQPMEQFLVRKVAPLPPVQVPGLGAVDLSITNSVLFMLIAAGLIALFFLAAARRQLVPGRMQAMAEMIYGMVDGVLTGGIIGDRGRPFLPFIFTLFLLIATLNVISLAPGGFSVTSQLAVTAALAIMTFTTVLVVGFVRNGLGFFKLFWPSSMHPAVAAALIPIELISFLVRPRGHLHVRQLRRQPRPVGHRRLRPCQARPVGLGGVVPDDRGPDSPGIHRRLPAGVRVRRPGLRVPQRGREPGSRPLTLHLPKTRNF